MEGVADRIAVEEADARRLPFAGDVFDVVLSSFMLHHIDSKAEREQALREMARVLKPGGRVAVIDIWGTGDYPRVFTESGLSDVAEVKSRLWRLRFDHTVVGRKPD
jgi:ubiquinone/menaquinone biosynthesis C-methylase UbiE